jgi:DUF4097 and DUF4098 domain-containing protein YvlB
MRSIASPGQLLWRVSGVATIAVIAVPITWSILRAGNANDGWGQLHAVPTRTITVLGTVSSVNVTSYGAPVRVTTGRVSRVTVVESISNVLSGPAPSVTARVSHGLLTLAAPACADEGCMVGFEVTVPAPVAVTATTDGGPLSVIGATRANLDSGSGPVIVSQISGPVDISADGGSIAATDVGQATLDSGSGPIIASNVHGTLSATSEGGGIDVRVTGAAKLDSGSGPVSADSVNGSLTVTSDGGGVTVSSAGAAKLDSGGGPVVARGLNGPLTVSSDGGSIEVDRLTGTLSADTGDGPFNGNDITATTSLINTDGGTVAVGFAKQPRSVQVSTGGGNAILSLPGGPYAVTAQSLGNPAEISVPVAPTASSTVSVTAEGGMLQITP